MKIIVGFILVFQEGLKIFQSSLERFSSKKYREYPKKQLSWDLWSERLIRKIKIEVPQCQIQFRPKYCLITFLQLFFLSDLAIHLKIMVFYWIIIKLQSIFDNDKKESKDKWGNSKGNDNICRPILIVSK